MSKFVLLATADNGVASMRSLWRSKFGRAARGILPAAVIGLGLGGALLPHAARAQMFWGWGNGGDNWDNGGGWGNPGGGWGGMRPGAISQSIAQRGFRVIAPLRRNGAVFVADVVDRRGRRERLIVAAADAQILQRFFLDDPRLPGYVPRRAMAQPQEDFGQPVERADRGEPVPPGSIPNVGNQNYGNPYYGNQALGTQDDGTAIEPVRPRPSPKVVKPRPKVVDRTPEVLHAPNDTVPSSPTRSTSKIVKPSDPLRLPGSEAIHPAEPATTTASRPIDSPAQPSVPAPTNAAPASAVPAAAQPTPSTPTTAKMSDPLAIPGGDAKPPRHPLDLPRSSAAANTSAPRVVPGTVTGAPASPPPLAAAPVAPATQAPAKTGDVPVAPLD